MIFQAVSYSYSTNLSSSDLEAAGPTIIFMILFELVIVGLLLVSIWKIFKKAGIPGWISLIPIYNTIKLFNIAGRSGWWILGMFVPFFNIYLVFSVSIAIAKNFGKDAGYGILLALLPFIGYPILAFGNAKYLENNNSSSTPPQTNSNNLTSAPMIDNTANQQSSNQPVPPAVPSPTINQTTASTPPQPSPTQQPNTNLMPTPPPSPINPPSPNTPPSPSPQPAPSPPVAPSNPPQPPVNQTPQSPTNQLS